MNKTKCPFCKVEVEEVDIKTWWEDDKTFAVQYPCCDKIIRG